MAVVVVVESDRLTRRVLCAALTGFGIRAHGVGDPVGAAHLMRKLSFKIDCLICASSLPRMSAKLFLKQLKSRISLAPIPFLFVVGRADERSLPRYLEMGADGFLRRPAGTRSLRHALCALKGIPVRTDQPKSLLPSLPPGPAATLMESAALRQVPEGGALFVAGSPPQQMALLLEGEMRVGERVLGAGEAVALQQFIAAEPLDEDVVAVKESRVALIGRSDVEALAVESEEFCLTLANSLSLPPVASFEAPLKEMLLVLGARCATGIITCGRGTITLHGGTITSCHHPETTDPKEAISRMAKEAEASFQPKKVPAEGSIGASVCTILRSLT